MPAATTGRRICAGRMGASVFCGWYPPSTAVPVSVPRRISNLRGVRALAAERRARPAGTGSRGAAWGSRDDRNTFGTAGAVPARCQLPARPGGRVLGRVLRKRFAAAQISYAAERLQCDFERHGRGSHRYPTGAGQVAPRSHCRFRSRDCLLRHHDSDVPREIAGPAVRTGVLPGVVVGSREEAPVLMALGAAVILAGAAFVRVLGGHKAARQSHGVNTAAYR